MMTPEQDTEFYWSLRDAGMGHQDALKLAARFENHERRITRIERVQRLHSMWGWALTGFAVGLTIRSLGWW